MAKPQAELHRRYLAALVAGDGGGAEALVTEARRRGWSVDYVGASTPMADLVALVARRRPDLVALSVTQPEHLAAVAATAKGLRRLSPTPRIMAGGAAFRGRPRAAASLGVDAVAADALSGMHEARRLMLVILDGAPPGQVRATRTRK